MQELNNQEIELVGGAVSTSDVVGWGVTLVSGVAIAGITAAAFPLAVGIAAGAVGGTLVSVAWTMATAPAGGLAGQPAKDLN